MSVDAESWWHYAGALPLGPKDHSYYVLRRIWADHTMQPPRGYWSRRSEDYLTTVLFQPLACLHDSQWLDMLLTTTGLPSVHPVETRFAFSCEELLDAPLLGRHGRNFVIADIMLAWRRDVTGLVAFEVKKPGGVMPSAKDVTKLETYTMLPSTRGLQNREGIFLVDDGHVSALKRGGHRAIGWSLVHLALMQGLDREDGRPEEIANLALALTRLFISVGVKPRPSPQPKGRGGNLSAKMRALLDGLLVREKALCGETPTPSMPWLAGEPTRHEIAQRCPQSTAERRVNLWSFDWRSSDEV